AGYGPYTASCEFLSGIDLRALARDGAGFLTATEPLYQELLAWFLPRVAEVEAPEATTAEAWRLLRAERYDAYFGPAAFGARVSPVGASGLDLRAGGRIVVEEHPELTVSEGVVSHAVKVPERVVIGVLARPRPGRPAA